MKKNLVRGLVIRWCIVLCCSIGISTNTLAQQSAGENNEELQRAQALHEQAIGQYKQGHHDDALVTAQQALVTRERILGPEHVDVAKTLNLLAVVHDEKGEYARAEPLYRRALEIREKILGKDHLHVSYSLNNLATLHWERGEYDKAEPLYRRALAIREKALGKDHPELARSLYNLAILHWERGEYDKAEPLCLRTLAIWENTLGNDHPDLAHPLNILAILHWERGEYDKAEPMFVRTLTIREKALGKDHPGVADALNNLANLHWKRGLHARAEPLYRRALAIREKALGKDHPDLADPLNNLGVLYKDQGKYDEAEALFRRTLAIREASLGKKHPRVADTLNNLANLHWVRGEYARAEPLYRRGLAVREKTLGKDHPDVTDSLNNLAFLHSARREIDAALRFHEQALHVRGQQLRRELRSGSEDQKYKRLARLDNMAAALSFHLDVAPARARAAGLAMNTILMLKGRVLDAMADTMRAIRERLDADSRDKLDRLQRLQSELAHLFHQGPGAGEAELDRYRDRRVALEREIDALDAEIARQNPAYRALARDVRVADIQAALPQGSALLELFIYRPYAFHAPGVKEADRYDKPRYAAYVVQGNGPVRGVDLGPVARIDAAARAFQESIAGHRNDFARHARALDSLIMEPIRPLLGNAQKLYVAPDGQLSMVSFAALMNEQHEYLIQHYSLTYLASGRDLVQTLPQTAPQSAPLIVANPRFDLAHSPMATAAAPTVSASDQTVRSSGHRCQPISPLPGTHAEANALRSLLDDAVLWTQEQATETALSTVHGPLILHIATHAFFLPDQEISEDIEVMAAASAEARQRIAIENGWLRSGLFLAGASQCRGSTDKSGSHDDGVLTALEANLLDLRGTRLVVLSACETGMGEVKIGQGIYGLRRAFAVAGAETLVMSLWRVSDAGTEYLMRHYYENLRRGHGRSEAMRAVQLDLIAQGGKRAHPFYWASFIVSGNDATLDGQPPPRLPAQPRGAGCAGCNSSNAQGAGNGLLGLIVALWLLAGRIRRRTTTAAGRQRMRQASPCT